MRPGRLQRPEKVMRYRHSPRSGFACRWQPKTTDAAAPEKAGDRHQSLPPTPPRARVAKWRDSRGKYPGKLSRTAPTEVWQAPARTSRDARSNFAYEILELAAC